MSRVPECLSRILPPQPGLRWGSKRIVNLYPSSFVAFRRLWHDVPADVGAVGTIAALELHCARELAKDGTLRPHAILTVTFETADEQSSHDVPLSV
jgi:hypothetical protein